MTAKQEQGLELIRCAEINVQNMVRMMPTLSQHPLLPLVQTQLTEGLALLEDEN